MIALVGLMVAALPNSMQMPAQTLAYAPAPVDNPLKGLVPYEGQGIARFPHSMEFDYVPWSTLMTGANSYDWSSLDALLQRVAARGNQIIFRVFSEYPDRPEGMPAFLTALGVKTTTWLDGTSVNITPDYTDERLVAAMERFIAALGARYDGDPRVGYLTAGMLGRWGEWHDYPRSDLFASKAVQTRILTAYRNAFRRVPILLRYPAGNADPEYSPNVGTEFGYHDDSFAFATLRDSNPDNAWYFLNLIDRAAAGDVWQRRPIGGEIRPEVWGTIFDPTPPANAQNFDQCVRETHATWLMDSGMFNDDQPPSALRVQRASEAMRKMGYELTVTQAKVRQSVLTISIRNQGVAPFYAFWPTEVAVFHPSGSVLDRTTLPISVAYLPPGKTRTWSQPLRLRALPRGNYRLALRVPNPMPNGKPLGFANANYGKSSPGWLDLGTLSVRR